MARLLQWVLTSFCCLFVCFWLIAKLMQSFMWGLFTLMPFLCRGTSSKSLSSCWTACHDWAACKKEERMEGNLPFCGSKLFWRSYFLCVCVFNNTLEPNFKQKIIIWGQEILFFWWACKQFQGSNQNGMFF